MTAPHLIDALAELDEPTTTETPAALDLDALDAPTARQPGALYECWIEGSTEPVELRVANREAIGYEKLAARHREWPSPSSDRPELGRHWQMTVCLFLAARRAGIFAGTLDEWAEQLVDWQPVKAAPADPTR